MANEKALLAELKTRAGEIDDLMRALAVLTWDQSTYMPVGGAEGRGRQMATLGRIAHERLTDPAVGRLLDGLQAWSDKVSPDNDDAAMVRVMRRAFDRGTKVPGHLVSALAEHSASMYALWARARPANDFGMVRDGLARTVDLSRQMADCFAPYDHVMDPLIDASDYGMRVSSVSKIFGELRAALVPLVNRVTAQAPVDDTFLRTHFPEKKQWDFGLAIAKKFGYDFKRGRQDKTAHPFMTSFGHGDVRITTRFREDDLGDGLFSTLHETGHALYEQGIDAKFDGTPLADGASAGIHESQSRLWENLVGRSYSFWVYYYPKLQRKFGKQLKDITLDQFYRAINKVSRSLVRTDADELTYNLHVIIRFDLEQALLEGKLAVDKLPEAWRARYAQDIGVAPSDDADGCLQDVHWYAGVVGGAFQGYTLGNILSVSFYNAALAAHPSIPDQIKAGRFTTLHTWLRKAIYRHGAKYTAPELVERVTGRALSIDPYVSYLTEKYDRLYPAPR
jgi:carboxypeptidase Taq